MIFIVLNNSKNLYNTYRSKRALNQGKSRENRSENMLN